MKKSLLLIVACIAMLGVSIQANAQSTAVEPYNGATHTYTFSDVEVGAEYEFYISTSTAAYGVTDINATFGAFTGTFKGTIAADGKAEVVISWANNASDVTDYYLFLKVKANGSTCGFGNYKAVHIMPKASEFNLAVTDNGTSPSCADITGLQPVVNKTDIKIDNDYKAGTTTISYTITRTKSTNPWNALYTVSCDKGDVDFAVNADAKVKSTYAGTISKEGNSTYVVSIVIDNKPGQITVFSLVVTSGSDDVTKVIDISLDPTLDHTINLMPKIGGFSGL